MKLEIPGQFRGPECRVIPVAAVALRKVLEPMFKQVHVEGLSALSLILRVGGSLGEFAPEPNDGQPQCEGQVLICNVPIRDHGWEKRNAMEVKAIIASHLSPALRACCEYLAVGHDFTVQILSAMAQPTLQADGPAFGGSAA